MGICDLCMGVYKLSARADVLLEPPRLNTLVAGHV
jgi:hypothetical protein